MVFMGNCQNIRQGIRTLVTFICEVKLQKFQFLAKYDQISATELSIFYHY